MPGPRRARHAPRMKEQRRTVAVIGLSLTAATAVAVPVALYVISARAVEQPAPDLWWLVFLPLVPGGVAAMNAQQRWATLVAVLSVVALTMVAGLMAAYAGDSRASQVAEALQYDDACNTASSGLSVPFRVDAAFKDVGRVESHHLHGPVAGGPDGCTMEVVGDVDESFTDWRAQLVGSGWRVDLDDSEVVVVRRGVQLTLFVTAGRTYLTTSTVGADDCRTGRSTAGEEPAPLSDSEVALASPPCS